MAGRYFTGGYAQDIQVEGNLAFVADGDRGLIILEVSGLSPTVPEITFLSADQTVMAGQSVIFTVNANGGIPLAYQWQKDGIDLVNGENVSGVNAPSLRLSNVQTTSAGHYTVSVANAYGSIISETITLTVQEPLRCAPAHVSEGMFWLQVHAGAPSASLVIEASVDLVEWERIVVLGGVNTPFELAFPCDPNQPMRFYRAVASP